MRKPVDRFVEKFVIDGSGCWIWTAAVDHIGYARFWNGRSSVVAHRWLWEHLSGRVPDGRELDHLCRVRHCVNPDHLEVVTHTENMRRGVSAWSMKTHCSRGHPYDETNTYIIHKPDGHKARNCRTCVREATRRYRAKQA